jgi:hypothetical protein
VFVLCFVVCLLSSQCLSKCQGAPNTLWDSGSQTPAVKRVKVTALLPASGNVVTGPYPLGSDGFTFYVECIPDSGNSIEFQCVSRLDGTAFQCYAKSYTSTDCSGSPTPEWQTTGNQSSVMLRHGYSMRSIEVL